MASVNSDPLDKYRDDQLNQHLDNASDNQEYDDLLFTYHLNPANGKSQRLIELEDYYASRDQ